jgi:hypothetical protein
LVPEHWVQKAVDGVGHNMPDKLLEVRVHTRPLQTVVAGIHCLLVVRFTSPITWHDSSTRQQMDNVPSSEKKPGPETTISAKSQARVSPYWRASKESLLKCKTKARRH